MAPPGTDHAFSRAVALVREGDWVWSPWFDPSSGLICWVRSYTKHTIISVFFAVFTMFCLIMVINIQEHDARPAEQPITRIVCFFIIHNHDFLLCF